MGFFDEEDGATAAADVKPAGGFFDAEDVAGGQVTEKVDPGGAEGAKAGGQSTFFEAGNVMPATGFFDAEDVGGGQAVSPPARERKENLGLSAAVGTAKAGTQAMTAVGGTLQAYGDWMNRFEQGLRKLSRPVSRLLFTESYLDRQEASSPTVGQVVSTAGKTVSDYYKANSALLEKEFPTGDITKNPELLHDAQWWVDSVANGMTSIATALAAGGGSVLGGAVVGGAMEAAPEYDQLREQGMGQAEASTRAALFGTAVALLERIPLEKILKPVAGKVLKSAWRAAVREASTEWAEEPVNAIIQNLGREGVDLTEFGKRTMEAARNGLNVLPASLVTGGLMGGGNAAATPERASLDKIEAKAKLKYGLDKVQRVEPGLLTIDQGGGRLQVVQMLDSGTQLIGEQDPARTVDNMLKDPDKSVSRTAAEALAAAEGNREAAGRALIASGWNRPGQTLQNVEVTAADGTKIKADVLIQLVSGSATVGTMRHEELHALAMLSGAQQAGEMLLDPQTGTQYAEENLAQGLARGEDHPVLNRIRGLALKVANKFRQNPQESLFDVAVRTEAELGKATATRAGKGNVLETMRAGLAERRARAEAFDGRTTDRAKEGDSILPGLGERNARPAGSWEAQTPNFEAKISGTWDVMEADELVTSDRAEYDQALQPRNRATVASQEQISNIAKNPDPNRLMDSTTTDAGAPLVEGRNQVVSGNGRAIGLLQSYQGQRSAQYRDAVVQRAQELGLEKAALMRRPVLVRRIEQTGGASLPEIAEWSNRPQILQRSDAEQAEADARMMMERGLVDSFMPDAAGSIRTAGNREFLRGFVRESGDASLLDAKGEFAPGIEPRVKRAVLAAVLGEHPRGRELVQELIERADEYGVKRQADGVMVAGPALLKIARAKPDYDVRAPLAQALQDLVEYQKGKQGGKWRTLRHFLAQQEMFDTGRTDESMLILARLEKTPTIIGQREWIDNYARIVGRIDTTTQDMFGTANEPRPAVLRRAINEPGTEAGNDAAGVGAVGEDAGAGAAAARAGAAAGNAAGAAAGPAVAGAAENAQAVGELNARYQVGQSSKDDAIDPNSINEPRAVEKQAKARWPGVTVKLIRDQDGRGRKTWQLSSIVVPKGQRGRGIGTQVMNYLAEEADKAGAIITLSPSTDFGATSTDRLRSFYRQFGFVLNTGRTADYALNNAMYRRPNPAKVASGQASSDSRYQVNVTPERDRAYLAAVERGDTAEAQRMVDEAAKAAGYTILFRGTNALSNQRRIIPGELYSAKATWFTDSSKVATHFANGATALTQTRFLNPGAVVSRYYVKLAKPRTVDMVNVQTTPDESKWSVSDKAGVTAREIGFRKEREVRQAIRDGNDGVVFLHALDGTFTPSTVIGVLDENKLQSADPITRDDQGRVIPLSERFNVKEPDIRYQVTRAQDARFRELTKTWTAGGDWQAWVRQHPAEYAELEKMRAEVLHEQGYTLLFRAGRSTERGVKPWSSWTPDEETADRYTEPGVGHGGDTIRSAFVRIENELDLTDGISGKLIAKGIGLRSDEASEYADAVDSIGARYPWEERKSIKQDIENAGYDAIRYLDDYPDGATTIVPLTGAAKSAEVTPDSTGRIPPPSEWGDSGTPDIRYQVTRQSEIHRTVPRVANGEQMRSEVLKAQAPQPKQSWLTAYEMGKRGKAEGVRSEREFFEAMTTSELDSLPLESPGWNAFFRAGFYGNDMPDYVTGWRYGKIPESDQSTNFREQKAERGVSLMRLDGEEASSGAKVYEMFNRKGDMLHVGGWYAGRGTDGEPLIVGAKEIKSAEVTPDSTGRIPPPSEWGDSGTPDIRYQVTRQSEIHRTVPRVANGEAYKAILQDIQRDPRAYYDTQNLAAMGQELSEASEAQLEQWMAPLATAAGTESADNRAVLAAAERMKRLSAAAATDPAARTAFRELTLKVSRAAGTWAQLVRQMATIPGQTPEAVVTAVQTLLEQSGITMSETDAGALREAAAEDIAQREELRKTEQQYLLQPSAVNGKVLDAVIEKSERANRKLRKIHSEIMPKTWGEIIKNLMQGNVLTPVSLVANTVGNIVNMPARGVAQTIAATTERALHALGWVKQRTVGQPLADQWAWVHGAVKEAAKIPRTLQTGIGSKDLLTGGEVYQGFQPIRAWIRLATEGKAVTKRKWTYGELPDIPARSKSNTAKLLVEGTLGVPAETMFRFLAAGDAPFYQAHYEQFLHELGRLKEYDGERLAAWMRVPDAEAKELATERAKAAIYQGESGTLANVLMQLANLKPNGMRQEAADLFNALSIRPFALFVKTPTQVLAEAHKFVNPLWSAGAMVVHRNAAVAAKAAKKHTDAIRHQREAMLALGRIGVGIAIWGAVGAMLEAGLLAGSGGKSEKEKELARLRLKPYHFNMTGLKRLLAGEDPSMRPGDVQADYRNLGIIGLAMNIASTGDEIRRADAEKRGEVYQPGNIKAVEAMLTSAPALGSALLDMSMMKGSYSLLQAIKQRTWGNMLAQWFETVSSLAMPNTLKAASRAVLPYMPETEAKAKEYEASSRIEAVGQDIVNRIATKLYIVRWMAGKATGRPVPLPIEDLPAKVDLFGRMIPMTPAGRGPAYHLIDTLKAEQIPWDRYAQEIDQVYRATNDSEVIPIRLESLTNPRTKVAMRLSSAEVIRLNQIAGQYTRWAIDNAVRSQQWPQLTPTQKAIYLKSVNNAVARRAREEMLRELRAAGRW